MIEFSLMSTLKEMKKLISKNNLFSFLIAVLILSLIGVGVKFLLKKEDWVVVEMWGTGGEWWWQTEAPPYWIANAIQVGDVEYDAGGKKIGEVIEIRKYEDSAEKNFLVKARLKVDISPQTGILKYKNEDLEIGRPLVIKPAGKTFTGNVVWMEGIEDKRERKGMEVMVKKYKIFPWLAETINVGDQMTSENGEIIAEVLDKEVSLAETTVVTDRGEVLARQDPLRRDVTLKMSLEAVKGANQWFFAEVQEVKVGGLLWLKMPNYNLDEVFIIALEE